MRTFSFCLMLSLAVPAMALSNRVFVRSTGMDSGTCPITAPCRSFSYAMTQVAAGGEIIALDTAGYGTFTATQSVYVFAAPGATAFIAVPSGTGITIAAGPTDKIVLRNLALSATGGSTGIDFVAGSSLSIENCIINGFSSAGVQEARSSDGNDSFVQIDNSTIRNNTTGVYLSNVTGAGLIHVAVSRSSVSENTWGLDVSDNTRGAATDSVFSGNYSIGVESWTAHDGAGPDITLERCTIAQNFYGILAGFLNQAGGPSHGIVRIAHNQIFGNGTGVFEYADGKIMTMLSAGIATNTIEGNDTNGTFSGTYTAK